MQTVYLNGELAKFGEKWETSCSTIPEILRLIECQTDGFRKHLMEAAEAGLEYTIQKGKDFIDEEELLLSIGEEDIIITEVPAGSKGGGLKAVLGVVIFVAAVVASGGGFAATFGSFAKFGAAITSMTPFQAGLALFGTSLAMAGISEMMMPGPEVDSTEENQSYLFQGPTNVGSQGMPVPLAYGELIIGGSPMGLSFSSTPITITDYTYNRVSASQAAQNVTAGDSSIPPRDTSYSFNNNENTRDNYYQSDYGCSEY